MTFPELGRAVAWVWQHGGLVMRVLGNPDSRALLDALKELGDSGSDSGTTLHEALVKRGVDTERLAKEIHPAAGPSPEGNENPHP